MCSIARPLQAQEVRVLINVMGAEGRDLLVWREVYERGKQIATEFDMEPSKPRTTGRQQHRVNVPATKPRVLLAKSCVSPSY